MAEAYRKSFKHWERRGLGLMAFTMCRHDIAVEVIKKGFREKKPGTLAAACRAAGLRNHPEFKPLLRKALKHKDMHVRVGAIEALRRMRSEEDVPLLFKTFCQDPSKRVRYEALKAIKKLTLKDHGFHPADWKEWYSKQIAEQQVPEGGGHTLCSDRVPDDS